MKEGVVEVVENLMAESGAMGTFKKDLLRFIGKVGLVSSGGFLLMDFEPSLVVPVKSDVFPECPEFPGFLELCALSLEAEAIVDGGVILGDVLFSVVVVLVDDGDLGPNRELLKE